MTKSVRLPATLLGCSRKPLDELIGAPMRPTTLIARLAVIATAIATPLACSAQDGPLKFQEGTHYQKVSQPEKPNTKSGKVQVAEVFSYSCGHCFRFDPTVDKWKADKKADNVEFIRVPTALGRPQNLMHSRAYYTAEILDVLPQVHPAIFKAIHVDKKSLYDEGQIAELFEEAGIDEDTFKQTFNSFGVESRVKRAEATVRQWAVRSVPTVVVDGTYWTNGRTAGSNAKALDVADFLAARAQ